MNDTVFPELERLIAVHTGLQLRPRERDALRGTLAVRMATLHLRDLDHYHRLLQASTPESVSEWKQLTARLTNNESYFFRDRGQMQLLREHILPELIARNRTRRSLRLWSAGCSTGEEPYSLAMLVNELLPRRGAGSGRPWEIVIIGTDIDEPALDQARRGLYGAWSFRTMDPAQQQRCFTRREGVWQVAQESRALVSFQRCNLVGDSYPDRASGIYEMDLILCRNVFIYFGQDAVAIVLPRFAQTLRDGGYLMTGHAEIQGRKIEPLQVRMFPASAVYQRVDTAFPETAPPADPARTPAPRLAGHTAAAILPSAPSKSRHEPAAAERSVPAGTALPTVPPRGVTGEEKLREAEACYRSGDYEGAIRGLQPLPERPEERALLLLAHAYANLGHSEEATTLCRRCISEFPFAAEPFELLAFLAQEQERYDDAKMLLKKALYLAPASPSAYLELAGLYDRDGDRGRARKMRTTALELLAEMPPGTAVGSHGGPTAQEWIPHLTQRLNEGA